MYLVPVLFTFCIKSVLKLKKKNSGSKRLLGVFKCHVDDCVICCSNNSAVAIRKYYIIVLGESDSVNVYSPCSLSRCLLPVRRILQINATRLCKLKSLYTHSVFHQSTYIFCSSNIEIIFHC